jgi:ubiquinone/menaquinone biosynthesis C-methylase UbiE
MTLTFVADLAERRKWIRLGWEQVATEYAKDRSGIFELGAKRLLELLHPTMGASLLDVGCGNGLVALEAVKQVGSKGRVIGSDIAATMVQLAQESSPREVDNISFYQMDAEWLGFEDATFDNVTCAFSLFQFIDIERALDEMWRVLKQGGRLGLSNWGPGYFSPIASLQRDLFREYRMKQLLTNPIVFTSGDIKRMLYTAGFTSVEIVEETQEVWFTKPEEVWAFNMDMGPFPMMLQMQFSHDQRNEIMYRFKKIFEELMTECGIEGTFHLLYAVAEKGG